MVLFIADHFKEDSEPWVVYFAFIDACRIYLFVALYVYLPLRESWCMTYAVFGVGAQDAAAGRAERECSPIKHAVYRRAQLGRGRGAPPLI
jgi:hypothetical protein